MSKSNLEKKLIAETRKLKYNFSNDTDYDVVCKLCGMKCKCWCNFGRHLKITHNTNSEEYYKVFYKNAGTGTKYSQQNIGVVEKVQHEAEGASDQSDVCRTVGPGDSCGSYDKTDLCQPL